MKVERATPSVPSGTILATAVALMLSGSVFADDEIASTSQFDWAVTYAVYNDYQESDKLRPGDLIGRDVHSAGYDAIGRIENLLVSSDGGGMMAIISLGSFYHLGSKLVAVPYQDLRLTKDGKHIYYHASKEDLEGRSEFTYASGGN